MDLFKSSANIGDSFYFRKGTVSTTVPWWRPRFSSSHAFLEKIRVKTDIFDRYTANIVGGCLFSWDSTWDLDIQLTCDHLDPIQLEIDIFNLYSVGLNEFYILPDVSWNSIQHPSKISPLDLKSPLEDFGKRVSVTETEKRINSDSVLVNLNLDPLYKSISKHLSISDGKFPGEKLYNRIKNNPFADLVLSYPVKDFLEGSEMDFMKNSNHLKIR